MKFLPLVWSNLKRKKARTIFTVLSVFVSFVLFGALLAIDNAFTGGVELAGADRLLTIHKVALIQPLPATYGPRIKAVPGVEAVTFANWFGGIYQDPKNFFGQMAVDHETFLDLYPEYVLTPEQKKAWLSDRTGAIVGRQLADRFGFKVGDRIPIQATIYRKPGGVEPVGIQRLRHLRGEGEGDRHQRHVLPLRLPERGHGRAARLRGLVHGEDRRSGAGRRASRAASTACSPTRRPRPRPTPRRPSPSASPTRWATSRRSSAGC